MREFMPIFFCLFVLAAAIPALPQAQNPVQEPPKEPAKDVNISGVWEMTVQTPQGDMTNDATFSQEKEILKVAMSGPQGMPLSGEGTVKDGAIQWTVTITTPQGDFTIVFKGKIDGEKMSGDLQMGDFGTASWWANQKKKK